MLSNERGARNNSELTLLMITHISHLAYTKIWRALSFSSDFDELQHSNRNFRSSCQWLYPSSSKTIIITKLMLLIMQNTKNKFYFEMSRNVQQDWHTRKLCSTPQQTTWNLIWRKVYWPTETKSWLIKKGKENKNFTGLSTETIIGIKI